MRAMSAPPPPETTASAPRRRRGLDALAGRCLFVLLAALLLFELVVRAIDWKAGRGSEFWLPKSGQQELFVPHPFLGCALRPHFERPGRYQIRINALGMRGADMALEKPPGTVRILATGGSTTFCTGARTDAAAWPAQLGQLLAGHDRPERRYEVGNCGVSGWTTIENLIDLELRRVELAPDAWIVYGAANDARPIQARGFQPDYTHVRRAWIENEVRGLDRFLLGNSHAYAWVTRGLDPEGQVGTLASKMFVPGYEQLHVRSDSSVHEPGVQAYLRNVEHMVVLCHARGILPILCSFATCASKLRPGDERLLETVARMNQGLAELAKRHEVPFIDLAARLSDRPDWYDDWMHHNDAGCIAFAQTLARALVELRLLGLGS
jgi:lysophospholipase L1-like esterase